MGGTSIFSISASSWKYFAISGCSRLRRSNSVSVMGLYLPLSSIYKTYSFGIFLWFTWVGLYTGTGVGAGLAGFLLGGYAPYSTKILMRLGLLCLLAKLTGV